MCSHRAPWGGGPTRVGPVPRRSCGTPSLIHPVSRSIVVVAHPPEQRVRDGPYGRISYTRLNGLSAARRKRVKPASAAIFRTAASPACAPSA